MFFDASGGLAAFRAVCCPANYDRLGKSVYFIFKSIAFTRARTCQQFGISQFDLIYYYYFFKDAYFLISIANESCSFSFCI